MTSPQVLAAVVCLVVAQGALAMQSAPARQEFRSAMQPVLFQAAGMTLEQAIAMVQMKYGARVMRANTVEEDGKVVHYIRLITPDRSRVWTVRVDATTGREF